MRFNFKAMSLQGELSIGTYEANNEQDVVEMLREKSLIPLEIFMVKEARKPLKLFQPKVKKKELAVFCRQFYTMLNAGVGIVKCLEIISKQTENKTLEKICINMTEEVKKGNTLSQAMMMHPEAFPQLLIEMVVTGEVSGNLDAVMDRMAIQFEKDYKLDNKIKSAMSYPIVLGITALGVITLILVKVMPTFRSMFDSAGATLPSSTRFVIALSDFMITRWYILLLAIIGIVIGMKMFSKSNQGRVLFDKLKLNIPMLSKQYKMILTTRFTRTLSTLLSSGIGLLEAIDIVGSVIGNKVIEIRFKDSSEQIRKGTSLSKSMSDIEIFPPMVISMIKIGEESGALDNILNKTADYYDEEIETVLQKLIGMLEPIMIVLMAIVVGFLVIAIMQPMFSMMDAIK